MLLILQNLIQTVRIIRNGCKPDFTTYRAECRKWSCWTNKIRDAINCELMQDESSDNYVFINEEFVGQPNICKKTVAINIVEKIDDNTNCKKGRGKGACTLSEGGARTITPILPFGENSADSSEELI